MRKKWNTARFFTETRHVSWVLFVAVLLWGVYGYNKMPKRKDPDIPVRVAVAICPWPGAGVEKLESLVTRRIEEEVSRNSKVTKIQSLSRIGVSIVYVELDERIEDPAREFEDIKSRLDGVKDLPPGAGPVRFLKDFGDTAALMLTVASPKAAEVEISLRSRAIQASINSVRAEARPERESGRVAIVFSFPRSIEPEMFRRDLPWYVRRIEQNTLAKDVRPIYGPGFAGVDMIPASSEAALTASLRQLFYQRLASFHPDVWGPAVIKDPTNTRNRLAEVVGDKYTFRELDDFTELIRKRLQTVPAVAKIDRAGVLKERIFLEYSQERSASYIDEQPPIDQILAARNITFPGGILEVEGRNITIDPSGEFKDEAQIGDAVVAATPSGAPVYLRDGVDLIRGYESPAEFLNYYVWRGPDGKWNRSRAITLAVQMRPGEQIGKFGKAIDAALSSMGDELPDDLIMARTSDQPLQVKESVGLFMKSLYEAIALVVLVALVGFWEWRSALLMALAIPITLAMTFGMMHALGVDLQQVSIASLILALGLLVDDPVVAGDAIKRELEAGRPRILAAWLGPTKLARAILFATITNIVAYLPFLVLPGDMGRFIYTLPVVLTCSLISSRIVSMTFIPLLGYCLLRHTNSSPISAEDMRKRRIAGLYYKIGTLVIANRLKALAVSMVVIAAGGVFASRIKDSFFPKDDSYLSYVDVWLPEDAPLSATDEAAAHAEAVIRDVAAETAAERSKGGVQPGDLLKSLTTFVGGGGPRFWFSVNPEQEQLNYAQILIQVKDKRDTSVLAERLQKELSARVPGARLDVRQLESGDPVGIPVAVRISGPDIRILLNLSERVKEIYRSAPQTDRIRDDWGAESFSVVMQVDPDRTNLAGFSNLDVARSSAAALSGYPVAVLREGDQLIPVVARLRLEERMQLSDIGNLYVSSLESGRKIPLGQVSTLQYQMRTEKILRRNQFRTITISCFPVRGVLASEVMDAVRPELSSFERSLPSGYSMEIGGEEEAQAKDFSRMTVVLTISVLAIFLALVFQFRNALKPMIVFATIPYGIAGAFAALYLSGLPFGFMAFLGIISLIGVIVSHVIVLFEFIEELREQGAPLQEALLHAGIIRLRPVLITVGATIFALFPLAVNGGPLWEPLCYAQIGGLAVATFVTLLLVPVLYSILVLDLRWIKWAPSATRE